MSADVSQSPYAVSPAGTPEDGLGYSRHYAQRIRNLGKTSKDSWIKRLWNHMFQKKDKNEQSAKEDFDEMGATQSKYSDGSLPPINREGSLVNSQQNSPYSKDHVQFTAANTARSQKQVDVKRQSSNGPPLSANGNRRPKDTKKLIPPELANSPYIAIKDRPNYQVERAKSKSSNGHGGNNKEPPKDKRFRDNRDLYMRKPVHPYLSQHQEPWRPKITRAPNMINLEKRAKSVTEKAMREAKIFTCIAPYPVDAFLRCSLRKRGWVEKFGPKANASNKNNVSTKLECADEEDYEAICDQEVPAPWEEDHGVYAMMSRVARHYPPKFIWGGRNVNSLILKSDVMVNHFPKARHFSSKVLLAQSLRDLPWQNDSDPSEFFPRCYVLGEDDKEDIIEDFRTTACMALLKWVLRMYRKNNPRSQERDTFHRENTKYEEVTSSKDCESDSATNNTGSIFDDIITPEPWSAHDSQSENSISQVQSQDTETECGENQSGETHSTNSCSSSDLRPDRESSAVGCVGPDLDPDLGDQELPEDYESLICTDDVDPEEVTREAQGTPTMPRSGKNRPKAEREMITLQRSKSSCLPQEIQTKGNSKKVIPVLKAETQKKGGEVPVKAVDWAISHLDRYLKCKNNEDLDLKYNNEGKNPTGPEDSMFRKRGLSQPQWDQLLTWYYDVTQNEAKIPMTESKLKEVEDTLRRLKEMWPQYNIDGKRNIWIIKPGDKSKAIGIEFTDKLADILKFVNNSTIQGTYVIQKYIERPLLVYKCKFDIRQWFLVTDWNPLTIWFYKECYLRICSQEYQYDSMHESVHLSNVAVQQNYVNGERSNKLPDNNYMTSTEFQEYLSEIGAGNTWNEMISPGMKAAITNTLIATQDINETRKNAFELYGADFMLSDNYQPWLIEINASPGMAPTSIEKVRLCSTVIEDTIKVVVDKKENKSCSTGGFELVLRDNPIPQTKCVDTKFILEGQRIKRPDLQRYMVLDQKNTKAEEDKERKQRLKEEKNQVQEKAKTTNADEEGEKSPEDSTQTVGEAKEEGEGAKGEVEESMTEENESTEIDQEGKEDTVLDKKRDDKEMDTERKSPEKKVDNKKLGETNKDDGKLKKDLKRDDLSKSPYAKSLRKESEAKLKAKQDSLKKDAKKK